MKKLLTILIASAVLYCLFAFVTLSFNPALWHEVTREFFAIFWIIVMLPLLDEDLFK